MTGAVPAKLFVFYVGGDCGTSNIELHDVRFSVGTSPEDCYPDLHRQWWGIPESLHVDCWGVLEQADGYEIAVTKTAPSEQTQKLFFVNLGGYDAQEFTELHRNVFVVAANPAEAKARGLQQLAGWSEPHKDNVLEIDQAIDVSGQMQTRGWFLTLTKAVAAKPFLFTCKYTPIGRR